MSRAHPPTTRGRSVTLFASLLTLAGAAHAQPDAGTAGGEVARFDGHKLVRVRIDSIRHMQTALALTDDVWSHRVSQGEGLDIRVSPEQYAALLTTNIHFDVLIPDIQVAIDAEAQRIRESRLQDGLEFYDDFRTYDQIKTYCQDLAAAHPQRAEYMVLGTSHEGREIFGLRITGPGPTTNRPGAIYFACQHAREWATPPTAVYLAEMLLEQYATQPRVQHLVNNVEFFIVPVVNPDGYIYTWTNNRLWRKNRKPAGVCTGIDLNRNWGHEWGGAGASTNTCSDTYRGPAPFSEPETQVIRDFVLARPNIGVSLDIHSYGQYVMSPWGYTNSLPANHAEFMQVNQAMSEAILSAHGRLYTYGPVYSHLYPASGVSVDWFFGGRNVLGFTTEVRSDGAGFLLPAASILPNAEENYLGELALAEKLAGPMPPLCYPNCDGSSAEPVLNVADFACFLQKFAAGDPYANCDNSTAVPVLNVADFACFLQSFAAGCR